MKLTAGGLALRTAVVLLILVGGMGAVSSAQSANSYPGRIVGVWDVQVTVLNCSNGVQVGGFRGLHKYELGGTAQFVPSTNPAALSPHVGVWSPAPKDQYQIAFKMYQFDPSGNNVGWAVVRGNVAVSPDGARYAGVGQAQFFDLNGNLVGASCPTFAGTRFK